jgi:hypothetical protein
MHTGMKKNAVEKSRVAHCMASPLRIDWVQMIVDAEWLYHGSNIIHNCSSGQQSIYLSRTSQLSSGGDQDLPRGNVLRGHNICVTLTMHEKLVPSCAGTER